MVDVCGLSFCIVGFEPFAGEFEAIVPIRPFGFPLVTGELVSCAGVQFFERAHLVAGGADVVPLEIRFHQAKSVFGVIG